MVSFMNCSPPPSSWRFTVIVGRLKMKLGSHLGQLGMLFRGRWRREEEEIGGSTAAEDDNHGSDDDDQQLLADPPLLLRAGLGCCLAVFDFGFRRHAPNPRATEESGR